MIAMENAWAVSGGRDGHGDGYRDGHGDGRGAVNGRAAPIVARW